MSKQQQTRGESIDTKLAVITTTVGFIKDEVGDIKKQMTGSFVTYDAFNPLKKLVYWMLGLIGALLIAMAAAFIGLVLKK